MRISHLGKTIEVKEHEYYGGKTYKWFDFTDSEARAQAQAKRLRRSDTLVKIKTEPEGGYSTYTHELKEKSVIPKKLSTCKITKTHSDGDLTLKCKDAKYVVTTEGETFKQVKK